MWPLLWPAGDKKIVYILFFFLKKKIIIYIIFSVLFSQKERGGNGTFFLCGLEIKFFFFLSSFINCDSVSSDQDQAVIIEYSANSWVAELQYAQTELLDHHLDGLKYAAHQWGEAIQQAIQHTDVEGLEVLLTTFESPNVWETSQQDYLSSLERQEEDTRAFRAIMAQIAAIPVGDHALPAHAKTYTMLSLLWDYLEEVPD